ncbi:MAG TPA: transglutaminase domain-containing protein, partial [Acidobacteriaceae bacterium]|nr:transglutaminase domain-containing protein [Acidobacteriaceae bacterium]
PDVFWELKGAGWSMAVDKYVDQKKLKDAVAQLVAPGDTDDQKLRKIYAAVMKLENTDLTRERTKAENKAENLDIRNAEDIWTAQRGNGNQLALLFIGLARAAGLKAYAMMVTDRDQNIFMKSHMDWDQLDDIIAIVNVDGVETYFDPGERYCEYGKLHWKHTWTSGVRQTSNGEAEIAQTAPPAASDTMVSRDADLVLDADGSVHGTIHMTVTGSEALMWRQEALVADAEEAAKEFHDRLLPTMPAGVQLKMEGFTGLTDSTLPLTATLDVTGTMGAKTGHRLFVPGTFFEAQAKARFVNATRQNPVFLDWAYTVKDHVRLHLPDGVSIEDRPKQDMLFAPHVSFEASYEGGPHDFQYTRQEQVSAILYSVQQYPALRDFFQKMNAQDQTQLVLQSLPAVATAQSR